jgi:hypothetical protein
MPSDDLINPADDVLMTAAQLKRRWGGCSDMLIWRRLRDDPAMPRPLDMRGRRLWYLSEIIRYERLLRESAAEKAAASTAEMAVA